MSPGNSGRGARRVQLCRPGAAPAARRPPQNIRAISAKCAIDDEGSLLGIRISTVLQAAT